MTLTYMTGTGYLLPQLFKIVFSICNDIPIYYDYDFDLS